MNEPRLLSGAEAPSIAPQVSITLETYRKLKCFVDLCPFEINGLGSVIRTGNDFTINEIFLLKQYTDTNGCHVELDDKALNSFIYYLVQNGGDPSAIRCQWHSHVNMPVFCSAEDLGTIAGYMNDFMVSLVLNKLGDCHCRIDLFQPFKLSLETPLRVIMPPPAEEVVAACKEEMARTVIVRKPVLGLFSRQVKIPTGEAKETAVPLSALKEEKKS